MVLINAVKEQQEQIAGQSARIVNLEAHLRKQDAAITQLQKLVKTLKPQRRRNH